MGNSRLPVYCAEILQDRGIDPLGMVSSDPVVLDWANQAGVPGFRYGGSTAMLNEFLAAKPFDYFLSIFNPFPLPAEILALPRKLALNYHNGPLPRYAGMHVTSWAILNGERSHGITWHVMTPEIDAGEIFLQRHFDLDPDETAFSANWKCFEATMETFEVVVDRLSSGSLETTPQNLGKRTYFSKSKRPPAGGFLDWSRSAAENSALVRALTFGNTFNPLGLPKIWLDPAVVIIDRIQVVDESSESMPGTILKVNDKSLTVATADRDVVVSGVHDESGEGLLAGDLNTRYKLKAGSHLPQIDESCRNRLTELHVRAARDEPFWIGRLVNSRPIRLEEINIPEISPDTFSNEGFTTSIRADFSNFLAGDYPSRERLVLAIFGLFLKSSSTLDQFDIGITDKHRLKDFREPFVGGLFSVFAPMNPKYETGSTLRDAVDSLLSEVNALLERNPHLRDLPVRLARSPEFKGCSPVTGWPIAAVLAGDADIQAAHPLFRGSELVLIIGQRSPDDLEISWRINGDFVDKEFLSRIHNDFMLFLTAALNAPTSSIAEISALDSVFEEGEI